LTLPFFSLKWKLIGKPMAPLSKMLSRLFRQNSSTGLEAFNCHEQTHPDWLDRAKIAAEMVSELVQNEDLVQVHLADVGCGDQKFRNALSGEVSAVSYSGFDLQPQSDDIAPFDIETDQLPSPMDIAVLLGVLEYSVNIPAALLRLRPKIQYLVVSHAVRDRRTPDAKRKRRMNWKSHLTEAEFVDTLTMAGFTVSKRRVTSNGRSIVWVCT
jgi:hypothetical protein